MRIVQIKKLLTTAFFIVSYYVSLAQDTSSSDGLFAAARKAAFNENSYPKAIVYCKKGLLISPRYADISIFLGRVYTWSKMLDSASVYFENAIKINPTYIDAYVGYADMEYWRDNYDKSISICNSGLMQAPGSTELLIRKAKNLYAEKKYKDAALLTDSILMIDNKNSAARALANTIKDYVSKNKIGISYDYVYFDKQFPNPWHLASIDYSRQTKYGSIIPRINYANRFATNGIQYEVDAYPKISKMFYSYVNAGYSNDIGVFPKWRGGASLYANLPKSFEAEVGIRYLYFTSSTNIYTLYLGKYYKSYLLGARTYLIPGNTISQSHSLFARYYFGGVNDYISATIGYGISPDESAYSYLLSSSYKLKSYKAVFEYKKAIKKLTIVGFSCSIINEEYLVNQKGNQIQAGIIYQYRF